MTPVALTAWRKRMNLTQTAAALALGCSRRSLHSWERGETEIPKYIGLACAALFAGIDEYLEPSGPAAE